MNILVCSAECTPFAKTGGLADVVSALTRQWDKHGLNPIIVMPKYKHINVDVYGFKPTDIVLYVPMGNWVEFARLWYGILPNSNVPVYLIENNDYFNREGIYGDPGEYWDNDRRFIFLSRAVFEASKALNFKPDIIHAHDYHTAFSMAFLKSQYAADPMFNNTAGIYTIHNLAYQGWFDPQRAMSLSGFGMEQFYPGSWFELFGSVNAMKTGLMFADKITTVSPNYAEEIRWEYFGEGLHDVLNHRGADLIGILNGADYEEWNPLTDDAIYFDYDMNDLKKKKDNKISFLKEYGITKQEEVDKPLIGMVTRLTEQKGIDLLMNFLEKHIKDDKYRFVLLGSGEGHYEDYFNYLAWKYHGKSIIYIGYNHTLAHKIICCSDFLFLPSRFEPCGLTQMYALKYGTIPIVRSTGGLADTVFEYSKETKTGNGFVFWNYNAEDFDYAIARALSIYKNYPHWNNIRQNAMSEDFSSERSAFEYVKIFQWALEKVRQ
jgi:starch synthase